MVDYKPLMKEILLIEDRGRFTSERRRALERAVAHIKRSKAEGCHMSEPVESDKGKSVSCEDIAVMAEALVRRKQYSQRRLLGFTKLGVPVAKKYLEDSSPG